MSCAYFVSFFFSADSQLVPEDPEGKKDEYAFDNPAFKTGEPGTGTTSGKTSSPLDPSWTSTTTSAKQNSLDKRKTVDDSCINVSFVVVFFFSLSVPSLIANSQQATLRIMINPEWGGGHLSYPTIRVAINYSAK